MIKAFKIVSISSNHNGFGLAGHILIAKDGEAYEVARGIFIPNKWEKGQIINVPIASTGVAVWIQFGETLVRKLPDVEAEVVAEAYSEAA